MNVTEQEESLDIRRKLIQALGTTPYLDRAIEETYNKRPSAYYEAFMRDKGYHNDVFFDLYPASRKAPLERAAGIVEYAYKHNTFLELMGIIKKGFPKVHKLITSKSRIAHADWVKIAKPIKNELEMNNMYTVFVYLVYFETNYNNRNLMIQGYENITTFVHDFEIFQLKRLNLYFNEIPQTPTPETYLKEVEVLKDQTINSSLDSYIDKEMSDHFFGGRDPLKNPLNTMEVINDARSETFRLGKYSSKIGFYTSFLNAFGIFENYFDAEITEFDMRVIQRHFDLVYKQNNLDVPIDDALIQLLILTGLGKEIHALRKAYELPPQQEKIDFLFHKKYKDQLKQIETDKEEAQKEAKRLEEENKSLQRSLKAMQEEKEKLEKELSRVRQSEQELKEKEGNTYALEQFVFNLGNDNEISTVETESAENVLKKLSMVVIGGHESWVERMKEKFPNFSYLTPEAATNRAIKNIKFDYVLFNVQKNSHGAYYRLKEFVPSSKFLYVNNVNIERSIEEIHNQIKR